MRSALASLLRQRELGPLVLLILVGAGFTLLDGNFLTSGNLSTLSLDATVVMLLAIGQCFVLLTGNIDLSTGALAAFGGVLVAILINHGIPWQLAVVLTSALTAGCGVVSGAITHYLKVPSFLATFGMLGAGESLALVLSNDTSVPVLKANFAYLGTAKLAGVPVAVVIAVGVVVIAELVLRKTAFGFDLYAYGGNPTGAVLAGVRSSMTILGAFALSGALAGLAGSVTASRLLAGYPSSGTGDTLFDSIAGAVVGGVSLFGGVGTAFGAFLGALLIGEIQDGMNVRDISFSWQPLVIGAVIVIGVAYDITARRLSLASRLRGLLRHPERRGTQLDREVVSGGDPLTAQSAGPNTH
jgi:ribose transport system permease protein